MWKKTYLWIWQLFNPHSFLKIQFVLFILVVVRFSSITSVHMHTQIKQLFLLAFICPYVLQIKFFHHVGSMNAPVTESEKLISSVLEAERPTIRYSMPLSLFLSTFVLLVIYIFFSFIIGLWFNFNSIVCFFLAVSCMINLCWRQTILSLKNIKVPSSSIIYTWQPLY